MGAALVLPVASVLACTTFYGLEPDATSSSSSSSSGGLQTDRALLPLADAAHLCSLVSRCSTVGPSIVESIGLPVVETGSDRDVRNFSTCVDWFTFPLGPAAGADLDSAPRKGFIVAKTLAEGMSAGTTCEAAAKAAFRERIAPDDARCADPDTVVCSDELDSALSCKSNLEEHCNSKLYPPNTACALNAVKTTALCASGICASSESQCEDNPGEDHDLFYLCLLAGQKVLGVNCLAFGLVCDSQSSMPKDRGCFGQDGVAWCDSYGGTSKLGDQSCSAGLNRVRTCSGVASAEIDCSVLGEKCASDDGGSSYHCTRPTASCSPSDSTINVCTGSSITLCLDGSESSFDCAQIGLGCVPASGSISAHCG